MMRQDVPPGGVPSRRDPPAGPVQGSAHGPVARFLGLPFAQAPIGALRFAAPQPVAPWKDLRQAVTFGPTAAQPERGPTLIPEPTEAGDDILNLNIFAPAALPEHPLPVLVYIHGGGFFAGCNRSEWFDGEPFVRNGVIVVAPNYRLGVEGFMPVEGAPDNRGLLDWIAALEWVRDNIAAFGGDPARVTVSGQSAGAGAVAALMVAPRARGLFRRAVLFSGSIGFGGSLERARGFAQRFAKATGRAATAAALADLPRLDLIAGYEAAMADPEASRPGQGFVLNSVHGLPMQPLAGTDSLPTAPTAAMAQGIGADIPVLITTAEQEFDFDFEQHGDAIDEGLVEWTLTRMGFDAAQRLAFGKLHAGRSAAFRMGQAVTDLVFRAPMLRMARLRKAGGAAPSWLAEYRWQSPVVLDALMRAAHCLDMPYYFQKLPLASARRVLGPAPPQPLADLMHEAVARFARGETPGWQPWEKSGKVRIFDWPDKGESADMEALAPLFG